MKLTVSVSEGIYVLNPADIIYLEASSNYTRLHLTGQRKIFSAKTLKQYENLLQHNNFLRVHDSFLINSIHICNMSPSGDIILSQNISVPVSKRKKTSIKRLLKINSLTGADIY